MSQELTLTFRHERRVFNNENSRVIIGDTTREIGETSEVVTIKGDAAEGQLIPGMSYRFYGRFATHHKWGRQFLFSSFAAETPATEEGIVAYLSQLSAENLGLSRKPDGTRPRGIGRGTAKLLWDKYGPAAIDRLRVRPRLCSGEIRGLSDETADAASEWLVAHEAIERCKVDLMGLLNGRGFPKKTVDYAVQKWGAKAADFIRANPYLLMNFRGCGFLNTDKFYIDLGKNPRRMKRQALCAWYAVAQQTAQSGDTWHRLQFATAAIQRSIGSGAATDANKAIELAVRGGLLARRIEDDRSVWVAEKRKADSEERLGEYVREALEEGEGEWGHSSEDDRRELADRWEISDHQSENLITALTAHVGVLAGSPGTGKTYTAATLIKSIIAEHGRHSIAIAAPTGKAAVRLSEALEEAGVPAKASTIHSLLGVLQSDDGDGWEFEHNDGNPLPHQFVIIDESSMIDTDLMCSLLAARAPGTHFLFIGDHRQLAPVGHGCPFYDFQQAGVPTGELTEPQRNAGRIVKACAQMRDEKRFDATPADQPTTRESIEAGENLIVSRLGNCSPDDQIRSLLGSIPWAAKELDIDPIRQLQVVCAVNKKSPLSREALNKTLQAALNPTGEMAKGNPFRVGDKLINLKNGAFPAEGYCPEAEQDGRLFVANGEQAIAVRVEPARTVARLQGSERLIVIPHGSQRSDKGGDDSGTSTSVGTWDLGYAISVHKSQGSEWPVVIVMLDEWPGAQRLCTRNWIYTAASRAKTLCLMIGKKSTADAAVRRDGLRRVTYLAERIRGPVADVADEVEAATEPDTRDLGGQDRLASGGDVAAACLPSFSFNEMLELLAT